MSRFKAIDRIRNEINRGATQFGELPKKVQEDRLKLSRTCNDTIRRRSDTRDGCAGEETEKKTETAADR